MIQGSLRAASFKNQRAVSIKKGPFLWGVRARRALLFGVYIRAPDFWKLPHRNGRLIGISDPYGRIQIIIRVPTLISPPFWEQQCRLTST